MGTSKTTLVPNEAAASVAAKIKTIQQCEAIIKSIVARYDGLKAFDAELEKLGVLNAVRQIIKKG